MLAGLSPDGAGLSPDCAGLNIDCAGLSTNCAGLVPICYGHNCSGPISYGRFGVVSFVLSACGVNQSGSVCLSSKDLVLSGSADKIPRGLIWMAGWFIDKYCSNDPIYFLNIFVEARLLLSFIVVFVGISTATVTTIIALFTIVA